MKKICNCGWAAVLKMGVVNGIMFYACICRLKNITGLWMKVKFGIVQKFVKNNTIVPKIKSGQNEKYDF